MTSIAQNDIADPSSRDGLWAFDDTVLAFIEADARTAYRDLQIARRVRAHTGRPSQIILDIKKADLLRALRMRRRELGRPVRP